MTRCWFFGRWSPNRRGQGHCIYGKVGWPEELPNWKELDCKYAPSEITQPLGIWRRSIVNGFTIIACWDRSADNRRNSNAVFIVEGERGLKSALTIAKQHFPDQVKRILTQFVHPMLQEMSP
jgi:hypothetical protein